MSGLAVSPATTVSASTLASALNDHFTPGHLESPPDSKPTQHELYVCFAFPASLFVSLPLTMPPLPRAVGPSPCTTNATPSAPRERQCV